MSWNPLTFIQRKLNKPIERNIRRLSAELDSKIKELDAKIKDVDLLRSRIDLDESLVDRYLDERNTETYRALFNKNNPLVSICVATYNRGSLLTSRTLPSLLRQTYNNIEIIVVGDCCTDDTAELIAQIDDKRLRFINLAQRGCYPSDSNFRWMVAGTTPMNHALELAQGDFITHLDDDDEHAPDRVEKLLKLAQTEQADIVWHPFEYENEEGQWLCNEAQTYTLGRITTSSVFYHRWFAQVGWDLNAWRMHEPGDWNRFRKFRYLGAKCIRHPDILLKHYRERSQQKTPTRN